MECQVVWYSGGDDEWRSLQEAKSIRWEKYGHLFLLYTSGYLMGRSMQPGLTLTKWWVKRKKQWYSTPIGEILYIPVILQVNGGRRKLVRRGLFAKLRPSAVSARHMKIERLRAVHCGVMYGTKFDMMIMRLADGISGARTSKSGVTQQPWPPPGEMVFWTGAVLTLRDACWKVTRG